MNKYNDLTQSSKYIGALQMVLKLSRLFTSSSASPSLNYRAAENLYCEFVDNSTNLSRGDIAIDAKTSFTELGKIQNVGVGIKTFLHDNGKTLQKIAEFNKDREMYNKLAPKEKIKKIAELRNTRLQFCVDTHNLNSLKYHCITRDEKGFIRIYNTPMEYIDIKNINLVRISEASIFFEDGRNEYSFNISKSTLFKRFDYEQVTPITKFKVTVEENPLELLSKGFGSNDSIDYSHNTSSKKEEYIILPLYSYTATRGKYVPEKSTLNIWNAAGRKRDPNEAYIGVPKKMHHFLNAKYKEQDLKFFPDRDTPFKLVLPDGEHLEAKLCQSDSKALMSNPNKALGQWILRKVLQLEEGEILTYDRLLTLGIDSVKITRNSIENVNLIYSINFCSIGAYDEFTLKNSI